MKQIFIYLQIIIAFVFINNCSNSTQSKIESQTVNISIRHNTEDKNLSIGWNIFSDPLTKVYSLKVNGIKPQFNEYKESASYHGYCIMSEDTLNNEIEKLKVTIKTEIGELKGTIIKPDTVSNVKFPNSIQCGDDIEVSWSGNADFYYINYCFNYLDENNNTRYSSKSYNYITEKSLTISNEIFNKNGIISTLIIRPFNGPIPENGINGNISGDGGGFIYYQEKDLRINDGIIVGSGI